MTTRTRRQKIELLLHHYRDYYEISCRGGDTAGDGSGLALPLMSRHPSVRELARCLQALAIYAPAEYHHVKAYYACEWRTVDRQVPAKTMSGKKTTATQRKRERILPPWADDTIRKRGVAMIAGEHKPVSVTIVFKGEPFIPDELLGAAA